MLPPVPQMTPARNNSRPPAMLHPKGASSMYYCGTVLRLPSGQPVGTTKQTWALVACH